MSKILKAALASLAVLVMCTVSAMAQGTVTGGINGTVTNPNKEVIAGATVTAKNNGTSKEASVTSDDNGSFKLTNLEPGTYTVSVNASGFAPFTNENVVVEGDVRLRSTCPWVCRARSTPSRLRLKLRLLTQVSRTSRLT